MHSDGWLRCCCVSSLNSCLQVESPAPHCLHSHTRMCTSKEHVEGKWQLNIEVGHAIMTRDLMQQAENESPLCASAWAL